MSGPPRLTIVLPAWNEAGRLETQPFRDFVDGNEGVSLLFVDDGSTDGTAAVIGSLVDEHPRQIGLLKLEQNVGKGGAVRRGLLHAFESGASTAGYLDADLAAPLNTMLKLYNALMERPDLVMTLGSRVKLLGWDITRSEARHYLGRVFATFASMTLRLPVYDTQCGAKVLRNTDAVRSSLTEPFLSRWLFDVELIARLRDASGASSLLEVPVAKWHDAGGSRVKFRDFVKAPWELWRISQRYPAAAPARRTDQC